jgi:hypothetical protein
LAGEKIYDDGESLLDVYKDLWLHKKQRDDMVEDGIASASTKYPRMTLQTMTRTQPRCSAYSERSRRSNWEKS